MLSRLEAEIDALPYRLPTVMRGRLGLDGKVLTLQQIGDVFDVTREMIRLYEKKGFKILKRRLGVTEDDIDDILYKIEELQKIANAT